MQQSVSQAPQELALTPEQAVTRAAHLCEQGNLAAAENLCRRVIEAAPNYHPAYFRLGLIAVDVGRLPLAADLMAQAAQIAPALAGYQKALCEVSRRMGRLDRALAAGAQAARLAPDDADSHYNFGLALADAGRLSDAAAHYRRALALNPDYDTAANNLGAILEKTGDIARAEQAYAMAVAANPRNAQAQNNLGAILSARGELDRARECFREAIAAQPLFVHAHYNLSTLKKYKPGDPHLAALERAAAQADSLPEEERMRLWFAVGKAREDTGLYDEAFAAYAEGNRLKRATFNYDESAVARAIDDIVGRFDRKFFESRAGQGFSDETPVFIVGMPRSGTTLIEQILSSHSGVYGAGELREFCDALGEFQDGPPGRSYMDWLAGASGGDLAALGRSYVEKIRRLDGRALRISDKMPGNFFYVGLIKLALPQAKIVYAQRDPVDTCLSNYTRLFNETMPFAYDLGELGRYARRCEKLMAHWRDVLPPGSVLDVRYEDVVADLEGQARRLVDYCGLSWEDECLAFHENRRLVKTASIAQVREPIYKSSVARAARYGDHLTPLREALAGKD